MSALGAMVHEGMSPDHLDNLPIEDVVSWFQIMREYRRDVDKQTAKLTK
jgi:hypothetical protein